MKTKILIPILLLLSLGAAAQTTKKELLKDLNRTGGSYYAYPGPTQKALTPAPEGYEPFYISHYGRHGSRYMIDNVCYVYAIEKLDTAAQMGILSKKGARVMEILQAGYADAMKRDGDLTPLGGRQHREIAHRMYERFPELLSQPLKVDARSSTIGRCMVSMFYFCQELQGLNPSLDIRMDASKGDMRFVVEDEHMKVQDTPQNQGISDRIGRMWDKAFNPSRLMKQLFTNVRKAEGFVDGVRLMECLENVAEDLQNIPELELSLLDIFTPDELFNIWNYYNSRWIHYSGIIPGSTPKYLRKMEVRDTIISIADRVIRSGQPTITLRFSHDGTVMPLTYMLGLKEVMGKATDIEHLYRTISIDRIIPMAANIQIIFYRKEGSDDVLVKFLLNENETSLPAVKTDIAPYYHWTDVKNYWDSWRTTLTTR
ncbi:MAG: histidine-type phosphatase [Bacteroidales bacterium]|nr:histidine-type phosphatase [Bacteroidales bacterium]